VARRGQDSGVRVLLVSLASLLIVAGCASRPPGRESSGAVRIVASGDTFSLALGESVRLGATSLTFATVAEDSRCPRDVTCVWEGNARVVFVSGDGAGRLEIPLNTSARFDRRAAFAGGTLELRSLEPSPPAGDPRMYLAMLHFEAAP